MMFQRLASRLPSWVWLTLLVLAVLLPGTAVLPLLDRDEPRFATATREMQERADWFVPTFNGDFRFDKPVLIYWLMRGGYAVARVGELGARLPSIAAALALVLLTAAAGRRWFDATTGLVGAAALATCLQFFIHGRLALADMVMVACVALSQIALARLLLDPAPEDDAADRKSRRWWWALWLGLALGFLAKGPIAWAVPALSLILLRWVFWRKPLPWSRLRALPGGGLMLVLIAAWGVPALIITHGDFFRVGIGKHVVDRGLDGFNARAYSVFFYLKTAPLSLFPWFVFLPLAWLGARRRWSAHVAWLVCWALAPYLIFTPYATQLPHYVLPGFPALFLLIALGLELPANRWRSIGTGLLYVLGFAPLLVLAYLVFAPVPPGMETLRLGMAGALTALSGLAIFAFALARRRPVLAAFALLGPVLGASLTASALRGTHLSSQISAVARTTLAGRSCLGVRYNEPSLVFYSDRHWDFAGADVAEVAAVIERAHPGLVIALRREIDPIKFWQPAEGRRWRDSPAVAAPPGPGWEQVDLSGFNPGRTRWQEVTVWFRKG
jgi:4-amino-4-deoxy-L-arabinose transferase-like glycosyltransferase